MTHAELVLRAVRWLRGTMKCKAVYAEMVTTALETPDAIGWTGSMYQRPRSVLVECKTSRSDLFADHRKPSRVDNRLGVGQLRYVMIAAAFAGYDQAVPGCGVPLPDDEWGLLVVKGKFVHEVIPAKERRVWSTEDEKVMLLSAIRRTQLSVPFDVRTARWESIIKRNRRLRGA